MAKASFAHLLGGRLGQLAAAVPDGDVPQRRQAVDVLLAAHVGEDGALAAFEDDLVALVGLVVLRVEQVRGVLFDQGAVFVVIHRAAS